MRRPGANLCKRRRLGDTGLRDDPDVGGRPAHVEGDEAIGAAEAATEAGIAPSYNVLDGFEGDLDEAKHRGGTGWKAVGLPWKQS